MRLFVLFRLFRVVLRPTLVPSLLRPFAVLSLYEDLRQMDGCLIFVASYIMPCPFASALGTPSEGFHSSRIHGFALNDILGTLALAGITSYTAKISFMRSVFVWFALAEVLHYAFGVRTAFLERLGIVRDCDSPLLSQIVEEDDSGGS